MSKLNPPAKPAGEKQTPKRQPLPAHLPRHDIHHEPDNTTCTAPGCGCRMTRIGEDVAEKLDYEPGLGLRTVLFRTDYQAQHLPEQGPDTHG